MASKSAEEEMRFRHLLRILVWAKKTTGKSSEHIVSTILNAGTRDLLCLTGRGSSAAERL